MSPTPPFNAHLVKYGKFLIKPILVNILRLCKRCLTPAVSEMLNYLFFDASFVMNHEKHGLGKTKHHVASEIILSTLHLYQAF